VVLACGQPEGLSVHAEMDFCGGWGASGRPLLSAGALTVA